MNDNLVKIIKKLTPTDIDALKSIYYYRCLDEEILYRLHYNKNELGENQDRSLVRKKIKLLKRLKLVEEVSYSMAPFPAIFLTPDGVNIIRESQNLLTNVYDSNKQVVKRGYYRAAELKLSERYIKHQMYLNDFVVDLIAHLNDKYPFQYYDEKHMEQYSNIRPDGLIQLIDVDFFLEMDMSTEKETQLHDKCNNYRAFLTSREYAYRDRKIIVLFIINDSDLIEDRKDLVRRTMVDGLLDMINSDFDIYIGSKKEIINMLLKKAIPTFQGVNELNNSVEFLLEINHGFEIENSSFLKDILFNTDYDLYIRKVNNNNNVVIEDGKIQEFLFDYYTFNPISILTKIAYLDRNNSILNQHFQRKISYLILVDSEEAIYRDLKVVGFLGIEDVYFTTLSRLKTMSFCESIFQIDYLGNIHHFSDNGLSSRIFEHTLM